MDQQLLEIGTWQLTTGALVWFGVFSLAFWTIYFLIRKPLWRAIKANSDAPENSLLSLKKIFLWIVILGYTILSLSILKLDYVFIRGQSFDVGVSLILKALAIFQLARFLDWVLVHVFIENYYSKRDKTLDSSNRPLENTTSAARIVKHILYTIVCIVLLRQSNLDPELYSVTLDSGVIISHTLSDVFSAVLVILLARLFLWLLTQLFLYEVYRRNKIDLGAQYAINQLLKYIVYIIAFFIALDRLGINMTLVWGGAAALLVGVGLGLQQTFNDFFSGIVLLFERSVSVGDSVQLTHQIGTIKKIGLRSSELQTRDNMTVIVPNSQLVNDKVINWNHYDERTRFSVQVGVAYSSDSQNVKQLLLQAAKENPYVVEFPGPIVRLIRFGESSIDFELVFFSRNYIIIEDVKSDLRFAIDKLFKEHNVEIPFPQRTLHVKNDSGKIL